MSRRALRSRGVPDTVTLSLFDAQDAAQASTTVAGPATLLPPVVDAAQAALAEAFADHVVRWAEEALAPAQTLGMLHNAAQAVSLATASGHACIELGALAPLPADRTAVRDALLASKVVNDAAAPDHAPLVLDRDDRLYLHRYFDYERRLAQAVMQRALAIGDAQTQARLAREIRRTFATQLTPTSDWQKLAVALAALGRFCVISGGPGTGKTTTVVNLLGCLLALDAHCRIALAAPTGKAAARMQDAVRQRAFALPLAVREHLPTEAFTIHRLLGASSGAREFMHDREHPLAYDVVVIDEASMLDLALAAKLFDAVPITSRIVLLGDKDQLAAVESGAVFSELSADPSLSEGCVAQLASITGIAPGAIVPPRAARPSPLHDHVIWLRDNFRFRENSGIGRLAASINAGDVERTIAALQSNDGSVALIDDTGWELDASTLDPLVRGYDAYFGMLASGPDDVAAVFDAFERYRVLCAQRETPRGVVAINERLARRGRDAAARHWPAPARSPWYAGRPVLVTRNDHVLKLYNGDIGIAWPDRAGNLLVHFRGAENALRAVAPSRLPEHDTAFATTVHKAQGSEFDTIALVLPAKASPLVTRELLYTAVTRARQRAIIVSGRDTLEHAVRSPTVRHSGLLARLGEVDVQSVAAGRNASV